MRSFILALVFISSNISLAFEALPKKVPHPKDNPPSLKKIELGKMLFFDPRLSKSGTISCNSCHNVMAGGEDMRPNSIGIGGQKGGRSAPTVWNAAFQSVQFWDGRAASLEDQAKGPITNPIEMGMDNHDLVVQRIASIPEYRALFKKVFGGKGSVTIDNMAKAIATYERTLVTPNSSLDRFLRGEKKALSPAAFRGMEKVKSVGCTSCHSGINFSGPTFALGQGFFQKFPLFPNAELEKRYGFAADSGRFEVTKKEEDKNFWRVPTWRNIALTAPYFHNGAVKNLSEAVRIMAQTQLNKRLNDAEVSDIVAFLESLTGEFPEQKLPRLPITSGTTIVE